MIDIDIVLKKLDRAKLDPLFQYDDPTHTYTYGGNKFTSVTTFIEKFKIPFDREAVLAKTAAKRNVPIEELDKEWTDKNVHSTVLGSSIHLWIENYYNRLYQELPTDIEQIDRINKFNNLFAKYLHKLKPLAFEVKIFSVKWRLAGTIDAIFYMENGNLFILDWKTNKKMDTDEDKKFYTKNMLYPFDDYLENKHNHYSIQLCLYAEMLKLEYDIDIRECYIVYIPPIDVAEGRILKCRDYRPILSEYLNSDEYLNSFATS